MLSIWKDIKRWRLGTLRIDLSSLMFGSMLIVWVIFGYVPCVMAATWNLVSHWDGLEWIIKLSLLEAHNLMGFLLVHFQNQLETSMSLNIWIKAQDMDVLGCMYKLCILFINVTCECIFILSMTSNIVKYKVQTLKACEILNMDLVQLLNIAHMDAGLYPWFFKVKGAKSIFFALSVYIVLLDK